MLQLAFRIEVLLKSRRFDPYVELPYVCQKNYSPHQRCICEQGGRSVALFFLSLMEYKPNRPDFFKLYFAAAKVTPPSRIFIYYNGRPLYCPAVFQRDRYSFALPKNLEEKMLAGELFADFRYTDLPADLVIGGKRVRVPESIVLSDRYE